MSMSGRYGDEEAVPVQINNERVHQFSDSTLMGIAGINDDNGIEDAVHAALGAFSAGVSWLNAHVGAEGTAQLLADTQRELIGHQAMAERDGAGQKTH